MQSNQTIFCDICGKSCKPRGIGSHKRLKHGIVDRVNYINLVNPDKPLKTARVSDYYNPKKVIKTEVVTQLAIPSAVEHITPDLFTGCERPDGKKLYNKLDVNILLARLIKVVFREEDSSNFLSVLNTNEKITAIIQDFEKRFLCTFKDVRKSNMDIQPFDNDRDNLAFSEKYAFMKYSR